MKGRLIIQSYVLCPLLLFYLRFRVFSIIKASTGNTGACWTRCRTINLQLFPLLVLSIIAKPDSVVKHREEDELAVPHQLESFRKGISRKTRPFPIGGIASTMSHLFFLLFTETREVGIGTKWSNVIRNGQRHSKVLTLRIGDTGQGQKRPPSVEEHKSV